MNRKLVSFTILINLLLFVIGLIYESNGGLRYGFDEVGNVFYSNDLMSSGGDDSSILAFGMLIFLIPAIIGVILLFNRITSFVLNIVQVSTIGIFSFVLFLVNLDTSLFKSIELGDYLLLSVLVGNIFLLVSSLLQLIPELKKRIDERIEFKRLIADEN